MPRWGARSESGCGERLRLADGGLGHDGLDLGLQLVFVHHAVTVEVAQVDRVLVAGNVGKADDVLVGNRLHDQFRQADSTLFAFLSTDEVGLTRSELLIGYNKLDADGDGYISKPDLLTFVERETYQTATDWPEAAGWIHDAKGFL